MKKSLLLFPLLLSSLLCGCNNSPKNTETNSGHGTGNTKIGVSLTMKNYQDYLDIKFLYMSELMPGSHTYTLMVNPEKEGKFIDTVLFYKFGISGSTTQNVNISEEGKLLTMFNFPEQTTFSVEGISGVFQKKVF